MDVAAAAVRVVGPAADLAATVRLVAARRVVIRIVRSDPSAQSPNECSQGERPA